MVSAPSITQQIAEWKVARRAVILAHHFQDPEVQEIADHVGDGLELAQSAQKSHGDVIVFCGVKFMAETTKVLNPKCTVLLPDRWAGCSLVDSCPVEGVRAFKKRNPNHVIVSYINTSVQVKAESDILCTAKNAVAVVNSIPVRRPILFLPDINLGNWVKQQTGRRNMQIWQGACIVHATFPARRLTALRAQHPQAQVVAHPACPLNILQMADFVGSISQIIDWCAQHSAAEFIVVTESGIRFSLEKAAPDKQFYFLANESCNCSECPYMRVNTLEKLLTCLETRSPSIELSDDLMARAAIPIRRMLELEQTFS